MFPPGSEKPDETFLGHRATSLAEARKELSIRSRGQESGWTSGTEVIELP